MDYITLGRRIRSLRKKNNLTQEQLAEQADVSASFLGHVERGSRIPSLETVMKLCSALKVSPNDLLGSREAVSQGKLPERICISPGLLLENIAELLAAQEIHE